MKSLKKYKMHLNFVDAVYFIAASILFILFFLGALFPSSNPIAQSDAFVLFFAATALYLVYKEFFAKRSDKKIYIKNRKGSNVNAYFILFIGLFIPFVLAVVLFFVGRMGP